MRGNEYVKLTKQYLKSCKELFISIENMQQRLDDVQQASEPAAPIASYSGMPAGGTQELNTVERHAEKDMLREKRKEKIRQDIERTKHLVNSIQKAVAALDEDSRTYINEIYMRNRPLHEVAGEHYISEQWARRKTNEAVKKIARMIFGVEAVPFGIHEKAGLDVAGLM